MPWSLEEENLLMQLRREQQLPWSRGTKLFSEQFGVKKLGLNPSLLVYISQGYVESIEHVGSI